MDFPALVASCELRHTLAIKRMAERVAARLPVVRMVLVSGPSSAGKTTSAKRIAEALENEGVAAMRLSTDDYFVGNALNPRRADGEYDYETIEAVDAVRLKADLAALFGGGTVRLRRFDFKRHEGFDEESPARLPPGGVVVLEGIHALNPNLTDGFDDIRKFNVYLNVLTAAEPFEPEEIRLLRRLYRDNVHRAFPPAATFKEWPFVMEGERKWIDPTRRYADAVFNTGLDYEVRVLKRYVLPLLAEAAGISERASLLFSKFAHVESESAEAVPANSILRETIGQ